MSIFDGNITKPNVPTPVANKGIFWKDVDSKNEYTLQKHKLMPDHWRIIQTTVQAQGDKTVRAAWGTETKMRSMFLELTEPYRGLKRGDVIGVHRLQGVYDHYGVYESDQAVYEFAPENGDFGAKPMIHVTTLKKFLGKSEKAFVLVIPESPKYTLYSPSETIRRAKSLLGETGYNPFSNNCEHFAIWCKTGVKESRQVKGLLNMLMRRIIFRSPLGL